MDDLGSRETPTSRLRHTDAPKDFTEGRKRGLNILTNQARSGESRDRFGGSIPRSDPPILIHGKNAGVDGVERARGRGSRRHLVASHPFYSCRPSPPRFPGRVLAARSCSPDPSPYYNVLSPGLGFAFLASPAPGNRGTSRPGWADVGQSPASSTSLWPAVDPAEVSIGRLPGCVVECSPSLARVLRWERGDRGGFIGLAPDEKTPMSSGAWGFCDVLSIGPSSGIGFGAPAPRSSKRRAVGRTRRSSDPTVWL